MKPFTVAGFTNCPGGGIGRRAGLKSLVNNTLRYTLTNSILGEKYIENLKIFTQGTPEEILELLKDNWSEGQPESLADLVKKEIQLRKDLGDAGAYTEPDSKD